MTASSDSESDYLKLVHAGACAAVVAAVDSVTEAAERAYALAVQNDEDAAAACAAAAASTRAAAAKAAAQSLVPKRLTSKLRPK